MEASINDFIGKVENAILYPIMTLVSLAAFVVFVWGVVEFVGNAADAEKRKAGQTHMIWGIIGLAIIFGANAIIALIKSTFGI